MNRSKLKSRLHFVSASLPPKRAETFSFSKRSSNHVKEESHPNDMFVDFFDYEDDLSDIQPSNELFVEDRVSEDRYLFDDEVKENFGIVLEEIEESSDSQLFMVEADISNVDDKLSESDEKISSNFFEISDNYCIYHLNSGKRCENEKESGSLFCLAHQQL